VEGGTKKRVESMQRTKMFMSVDSDKSAGASTAGGASNAGSDVAGQLDSSTKVRYGTSLSSIDKLQYKSRAGQLHKGTFIDSRIYN